MTSSVPRRSNSANPGTELAAFSDSLNAVISGSPVRIPILYCAEDTIPAARMAAQAVLSSLSNSLFFSRDSLSLRSFSFTLPFLLIFRSLPGVDGVSEVRAGESVEREGPSGVLRGLNLLALLIRTNAISKYACFIKLEKKI